MPSWMKQAGLSEGGDAPEPHITPGYEAAHGVNGNSSASRAAATGLAGSWGADSWAEDSGSWDWMADDAAGAAGSGAAEAARQLPEAASTFFDGPRGRRPTFGVEAEVPQGFEAPGPGPWLDCWAGERITAERVEDRQVFAVAGEREGWLNVQAVQLSLNPWNKFHEFQIQIPASKAAKRLGIAFIVVSSPIRGLAVALVLPDSMVGDYNRCMGQTFPRSQLMEGDLITWVDGARTSEPEEMSQVLHGWRSRQPVLRLRALRLGLCRMEAKQQQPQAKEQELLEKLLLDKVK